MLECPPYNDQLSHPHVVQTLQFPFDKVEAEEVIKQTESQTQPQAQTTGSSTKGKGKGKASYEEWTNKEQSFLVDLWAKKHDCLESKDARKV